MRLSRERNADAPIRLSDVTLQEALQNLKPSPIELMLNNNSSIENWNSRKVSYLPVIPLEYLQDRRKLDTFAWQMSQTLLMETVNIGNLMGFSIELGQTAFAAAAISCLLDSGFTYVTSEGGKLMASLATKRSMLQLLEFPSFQSLYARQKGETAAGFFLSLIAKHIKLRPKI